MDARYCDMCKKLFKSMDIIEVSIIGLYQNEDLNLDFCAECRTNLTELLKR